MCCAARNCERGAVFRGGARLSAILGSRWDAAPPDLFAMTALWSCAHVRTNRGSVLMPKSARWCHLDSVNRDRAVGNKKTCPSRVGISVPVVIRSENSVAGCGNDAAAANGH